mmetsp:Transcript_6130/g.38069  ORF Transcript_6130/g.38069 Transcript_6130/m.38069 type:complete len:214 (-) Transcript_6130:1534-2175(-)
MMASKRSIPTPPNTAASTIPVVEMPPLLPSSGVIHSAVLASVSTRIKSFPVSAANTKVPRLSSCTATERGESYIELMRGLQGSLFLNPPFPNSSPPIVLTLAVASTILRMECAPESATYRFNPSLLMAIPVGFRKPEAGPTPSTAEVIVSLPARDTVAPSKVETLRMRKLELSATYTYSPSGDAATPLGKANFAEEPIGPSSKPNRPPARVET